MRNLFSLSFRIILRLGSPKFVILAVLIGYQLSMSALLDDFTLVEHCDLVAELTGRKSVTDVDGRFVTGDVIELTVLL